jgi:hypothetical protein
MPSRDIGRRIDVINGKTRRGEPERVCGSSEQIPSDATKLTHRELGAALSGPALNDQS